MNLCVEDPNTRSQETIALKPQEKTRNNPPSMGAFEFED